MTTVDLSPRVARWKAAWQARDRHAVLALYDMNCRHASAKVSQILPALGRSELRGIDEIGAYAEAAFARIEALRFEILSLTENEDRSVVEYRRYSDRDGERPNRVVEILEWRDERLRAVRVFHF